MAFSLFKKRKKEDSKKDSRYHNLTIKEVREVGKDTVSLIFDEPDDPFHYEPGQFITLIDTIDGKKLRRAYSLCSTPALDICPAVTVKRVEGGLMSNFINDNYRSGLQIEVMEPMGMFTTEYDPDRKRQLVFFGGGSGITPLFSIIRTVLLKEPESQITLVYGNRKKEYIIFREELEALRKMNDNFHLIQVLEEDASGFADIIGRPTEGMISEIAEKIDVDDATEYFICGPEPMMNVVIRGLRETGIEEHQIKYESFEAGKTSPSEIISDNENDDRKPVSEVLLELDGEQYSLTLDRSRPILEQALEKNLDMPYSCQSGLCTACRGKCLEGEVSVDEAEGLTEEELNEGFVLTCVGKPLADKIRIEIG